MKILHVAGGSIGSSPGGVEGVIINLYENIDRSHFVFDVVYHALEDKFTEKIKELGGRVFIAKKPNEIGMISYYKQIKTILETEGPYDVIHVHTMQYIGLALFAAINVGIKKRISHLHSTTSHMKISIRNLLVLLYTWVSIAFFSTTIFAVSDVAAQSYVRFGRKYSLLHNAFDPEKYLNIEEAALESCKSEFGYLDNKKVIGTVGRCSISKNHFFIVKLAEKLRDNSDYIFVIAGDGELLEPIKAQVQKKGLSNIILLGSRNDIPLLLRLFNLFILPSLYEGLGLSILEAQLAGVKCIASDAVPVEVDLELGIIKFLPLNDIDVWISEITLSENSSVPSPAIRKQKFIDKGYDINEVIAVLEGIYDQ